MNGLLRALTGGPVAKAAADILKQRIKDAENAFAEEVDVLEKDVTEAIAQLEAKLEKDTENVLAKHVARIFHPAS